jgi:hypothetical protein
MLINLTFFFSYVTLSSFKALYIYIYIYTLILKILSKMMIQSKLTVAVLTYSTSCGIPELNHTGFQSFKWHGGVPDRSISILPSLLKPLLSLESGRPWHGYHLADHQQGLQACFFQQLFHFSSKCYSSSQIIARQSYAIKTYNLITILA